MLRAQLLLFTLAQAGRLSSRIRGPGHRGVSTAFMGDFSQTTILSSFADAALWGRNCTIHDLSSHKDVEKFTAAYNECNGVADIVFYRVSSARFCKGCGRGDDWHDGPLLVKAMAGKKKREYATVDDYGGVGYFKMDRGHMAPVGSFNADRELATYTNMPANLSPQAGFLNQKAWLWLEAEMRVKAKETAGHGSEEVEVITGPLYQLPEAFFQNGRGQRRWQELLWTGGGEVNMGQLPWCSQRQGLALFSSEKGGRHAQVSCEVKPGASPLRTPNKAPNRLKISFRRSKKHFPLRVPLGYYKLGIFSKESAHGRQSCPYIFDQTGQCLLVSVKLLGEIAHLDLRKTAFGKGGGNSQRPKKEQPYTGHVDPDFCLRRSLRLAKTKTCVRAEQLKSVDEITEEMFGGAGGDEEDSAEGETDLGDLPRYAGSGSAGRPRPGQAGRAGAATQPSEYGYDEGWDLLDDEAADDEEMEDEEEDWEMSEDEDWEPPADEDLMEDAQARGKRPRAEEEELPVRRKRRAKRSGDEDPDWVP